MSNPTELKRKKDQIYLEEGDGCYAVLIGREREPDVIYCAQCIRLPEQIGARSMLWVLSKEERHGPSGVEERLSYWTLAEAWQKAHDLAMDYAQTHLELSKVAATLPVEAPGVAPPMRSPNFVQLIKIIDNSKLVSTPANDEFVEYLRAPIRFVL